MNHINVTINGRQYRMACEEGQEIRLLKLAENLEQRIETLRELRLQDHALFCCADANPRFKCTSRIEIAAGVTPEMRAACPSVSGRC